FTQLTNTDGPELDHATENPSKSASLVALKPTGVDLHHARRPEGLHVTVEGSNQYKGRQHPADVAPACETEKEVEQDGAKRADRHRLLAADAIGEEAIDELPDGIAGVAARTHRSKLVFAPTEFLFQLGGDDAQVVAAQVVSCV